MKKEWKCKNREEKSNNKCLQYKRNGFVAGLCPGYYICIEKESSSSLSSSLLSRRRALVALFIIRSWVRWDWEGEVEEKKRKIDQALSVALTNILIAEDNGVKTKNLNEFISDEPTFLANNLICNRDKSNRKHDR